MPTIKKPSFRKKKAPPRSSYIPIFSTRTKILLFSGLFLMLIPLVFYINQTIQLMYVVPQAPPPQVVKPGAITTYPPAQIVIPAVRIKLPVSQTTITNNTWGIAQNGASHLTVSANPGQAGPIILYGHNTNDRFGPIRWLKKGSEVTLTTTDGKNHMYRISETKQTTADQLSVFFERRGETLYLFTCDGFADLKRYIVIAEPATASPSAKNTVNQ